MTKLLYSAIQFSVILMSESAKFWCRLTEEITGKIQIFNLEAGSKMFHYH